MKFKSKFVNFNFLPLVVVVLFGLLASKGLIGPGYFNMHDDLQMMRQLEMEKCFLSFQIPCRWVPDMGYGFGFPLFNFYPPLPYLIGEAVRLFGFAFVETIKIVFILAFIGSGVTMYFLAKEFFGRLGGIFSAIFYIWAPYHAVDIYVRGAMNEAWALVWFPLTFLFGYKLILEKKNKTRWIILLALSWSALLVSHNLMAMIFAPLFGLWCFIWIFLKKSFKSLPHLLGSGIFAICLVAFFTLPVLVEQKYTHADSLVQGYYEYVAHFASISQILFSRFWGYGPSVWMTQDDRMSFQIGHLHWILPLIIFGLTVLRVIKTKKIDQKSLILLLLFFGGSLASFMIHPRSIFIWQMFKTLSYVQFPWRFLTLVIFCFSFLIGGLTLFLTKKLRIFVVLILSVSVVIFNWQYFLPEFGKLGPLTDSQKFTGAAWDLQQTAGIYDYLPKVAKTAPKAPRKEIAEVLEGKASIKDVKEATSWASFEIEAEKDSLLRLGIFQFPNWRTFVDGKEVENFVPETEEWGRMYIKISQGKHSVLIKLYDTPIRTIGNIISLFSWGALIGYLMLQFKRGNKRRRAH